MAPPTPITFLITDLLLGGTPLLLRDLALALRPHNFAPTIISLKPLPPTTPPTPPGRSHQSASDVLSFDHSPFEFDSSFVLRHSSLTTIPQQLRAAHIPVHSLNLASLRHLPRALPKLIHILNRLHPSILYAMLIHANALATAALPFLSPRPKFIQSLHTLQPNPRWHWTLQGILAPHADALIVPAQPILDTIARHGGGANVRQSIVIPNGIDIDRFANASPLPADSLPWPAGTPVIGYLGRFDPVKNLPLLLHAFARLSNPLEVISVAGKGISPVPKTPECQPPHLALVGYGHQEQELKNLTTRLHLAPRVHFLGPTSTPERWLKSFTVFCLPSAVEGFGLTLLESMAASLPLVALKTPVSQSIVRPQDGLLLPVSATPETLTTALQEVMSISRQTPPLPTHAPNPTLFYLHSTFSIERMAELHANFFRNLLAT